jgi:hypothetical protein
MNNNIKKMKRIIIIIIHHTTKGSLKQLGWGNGLVYYYTHEQIP